jgi:Peptidase family M28/PDZ domain
MTKRLMVVAILLLGGIVRVPAAEPAVTEQRMNRDLRYLAGDDCEGRGITTRGINLAADYVKHVFQQSGLKPGGPDGTYFQQFTLTTGARPGKDNRMVLTGPLGQKITLQAGKHFSTDLMSSSGKASAPLVFAGYGITSTKPAHDDYAGLDVAGRVVVILSGIPTGHPQANELATHADMQSRVATARRHQALALIVVNDRATAARSRDRLPLSRGLTRPQLSEPYRLPVVHLRRDWLDWMLISALGTDLTTVERATASGKPRPLLLPGWTCSLATEVRHETTTVKNVIGVREGKGPLAKETVIVGAHYDHVGYGMTRSLSRAIRGTSPPGGPGGVGFPLAEMARSAIHYGADDNASGTTTVLELARRLGPQKTEGRRLVFITFSAEESGLLGSRYYCAHPVFPLADTAAMLNLDMVGRLQNNKLMVESLGTAKVFPAMINRLNARHHFDLMKDEGVLGGSDHVPFFQRKVPVLALFTGFHEQYHRPTDRFDTIDIPGLRRVAGLAVDILEDLVRLPKRPTFNEARMHSDRKNTPWGTAPSVGVVPASGAAGPGILVEEVVPDTPAARAGVKKGDRLVALAGKPVKSLTGYLAATRALKPGEKVELGVLREDKEQKLSLQLASIPRGLTLARLDLQIDFSRNRAQGLLVVGVGKGGPAARAGLNRGDRITEVNGTSTQNVEAVRALFTLQSGARAELTVTRDGKERNLSVTAR